MRPFTGAGKLSYCLRTAGVYNAWMHSQVTSLNAELSEIAHGRRVTLETAQSLLDRVASSRKVLNRLRSKTMS